MDALSSFVPPPNAAGMVGNLPPIAFGAYVGHTVGIPRPSGSSLGGPGGGDGRMVGGQDSVQTLSNPESYDAASDRDGMGGPASGNSVDNMHPCALNGHGGANCGNSGPGNDKERNLGSLCPGL